MAKTPKPKVAVTQKPVNSKRLVAKIAKWALYQGRVSGIAR